MKKSVTSKLAVGLIAVAVVAGGSYLAFGHSSKNGQSASVFNINPQTIQSRPYIGHASLAARIDADNLPDHVVQVNEITGNTSNVQLLKFDLTTNRASSVTVKKFPVTLVATTLSGAHVSDIVNNITLRNSAGQAYTANIPAACSSANTVAGVAGTNGCTVDFGSDSGFLNWTVSSGSTQVWTVTATIKPTDAPFVSGDSITTQVDNLYTYGLNADGGLTSGGLSAIDASGNTLTGSSALGGSAMGTRTVFAANGISVSEGNSAASASQLANAPDQTGTFTLGFNVTSIGEGIYIPKSVTSAADAIDGKVHVDMKDLNSNSSVSGSSSALTSTTTIASDTATDYYIAAGTSRSFTVTTAYTATNANGGHSFELGLVDINNSPTSGSGYSAYTINLANIHTNPLILQ